MEKYFIFTMKLPILSKKQFLRRSHNLMTALVPVSWVLSNWMLDCVNHKKSIGKTDW